MDKTIRKIKLFAIEEHGQGNVALLGEFNNLEDITIRIADFDKDIVLEFEEYYLGGEE